MPSPAQTLDVWIVESNAVYRGVPFTVVTDWVQQGRLLEEDRVRPTNTPEWKRLAEVSTLAAYLPRAEPFRADDRAEALEPVELDVRWKKRPGDDDEDVDMIPLIDVSLVLLIFFMLTATVGGAAGLIATPRARHGHSLVSTQFWVGIDCRRDADGQPLRDADGFTVPVYSFGQGDKLAERDAWNLASRDEVVKKLDAAINPGDGVEMRVKAHEQVSIEIVRDLTVALERLKLVGKVSRVYAEVSGEERR